ncbi:hypothetical protein [Qipengyuania sediminis]|uniref:hypothetical protein n=1 Tax=Qipengyuania sediminis TaxID=1532023 RepID=UPI00105A7302|nr:hypothetical protein [Qipengyuania sediminis]
MGEEDHDQESGGDAGYGLAEAQIAAIEEAFAERDRTLARLRREVDDLRAASNPGTEFEQRLSQIEARLEQQDQALKHMLQRLIGFFGGNGEAP